MERACQKDPQMTPKSSFGYQRGPIFEVLGGFARGPMFDEFLMVPKSEKIWKNEAGVRKEVFGL